MKTRYHAPPRGEASNSDGALQAMSLLQLSELLSNTDTTMLKHDREVGGVVFFVTPWMTAEFHCVCAALEMLVV